MLTDEEVKQIWAGDKVVSMITKGVAKNNDLKNNIFCATGNDQGLHFGSGANDSKLATGWNLKDPVKLVLCIDIGEYFRKYSDVIGC